MFCLLVVVLVAKILLVADILLIPVFRSLMYTYLISSRESLALIAFPEHAHIRSQDMGVDVSAPSLFLSS